MTATVIAWISLVIALASLSVVIWQSRSLAQQARISTEVAGGAALTQFLQLLHRPMQLLVEKPRLHRVLYGTLQPRGDEDSQAEDLADMLADAIEHGLELHAAVSSSVIPLSGISDYAVHMLSSSPVLVARVTRHKSWWPRLSGLVEQCITATQVSPPLAAKPK